MCVCVCGTDVTKEISKNSPQIRLYPDPSTQWSLLLSAWKEGKCRCGGEDEGYTANSVRTNAIRLPATCAFGKFRLSLRLSSLSSIYPSQIFAEGKAVVQIRPIRRD